MSPEPDFEMSPGDNPPTQPQSDPSVSSEEEPMVDPEEARLEGGLVDPMENGINANEDEALQHLATGAQKAMAVLVGGMTPKSSGRTLLQISKTAGHLHRITMLYGAEDDFLLEGSPLAQRRIHAKRRMTRETAGVKMMQEVIAVIGQLSGKRNMTDDLRAVKAAKDAGMDDVAESLEAKIRARMNEPTPAPDSDTIAELGKSVVQVIANHADAQEGGIGGMYSNLSYGMNLMGSNDNFGLALPAFDDDMDLEAPF